MFGAVPAALTFYWRSKMAETARYTALVEGDHEKAKADMAKVLEKDILVAAVKGDSDSNVLVENSSYGLFSREFFRRHGLHLLGTSSTWFLLDIAFYSLQLTQKDVYPASGLLPKASTMNAIEEVYLLSKAMLLIALAATVPGYWFTVFLIDKIGRKPIQLGGFLLMSIFMAVLGYKYGVLRGEKCEDPNSTFDFCKGRTNLFTLLFGLTFCFLQTLDPTAQLSLCRLSFSRQGSGPRATVYQQQQEKQGLYLLHLCSRVTLINSKASGRQS